MFLEAVVDFASASPWTYAVVLGIAALDALLPLVPSEATVISAGVLAGAGDLNLGLVIAAAAAGAYTGDSSAYWLGRLLGSRVARRLFSVRRRLWAERLLERHGGSVIFGARFVPGGRTATTVSAGMLGMRWPRFAAFAGVAAVGWAVYAALLGYLGGRAFESVLWGLLLGFGVAAATFLAVEVTRRARSRRLRAVPSAREGRQEERRAA